MARRQRNGVPSARNLESVCFPQFWEQLCVAVLRPGSMQVLMCELNLPQGVSNETSQVEF